jgi:predicted DCC family thiol-disulfide oxidoreductase YuxK
VLRVAPPADTTVAACLGGQFYTHSGAALRIFALLQQPWRSVSVFYLVRRTLLLTGWP